MQSLAKSAWFPYAGTAVRWKHRKGRLVTALSALDTDIICMQEVENWSSWCEPMLLDLGYDGCYLQKPYKQHGCAVAWRRDRFKLKRQLHLNLDCCMHAMAQLAKANGFPKSVVSEFGTRCVAVAVELEDSVSGGSFFAVSTHLYWNPEMPHVKLAQAAVLRLLLASYNTANLPVALGGDFNSLVSV